MLSAAALFIYHDMILSIGYRLCTFCRRVYSTDGLRIDKANYINYTWEQCKLSGLANETNGGGTPKTSVDSYWSGNIPWIQSSDIKENEVLAVDIKKTISQEAISNSATKLIPKNSIAIVTRVGVGKLAIIPFSYTTSQDFLSLSGLKTDLVFTAYLLYKKMQSDLNSVQGTAIKGITKEELLNKNILLPELAEQDLIGKYFQRLDNLITLHQRKYDKLVNVKKAMLEKMFPKDGAYVPEIRFKGFTEAWEQRKLCKITNYSNGKGHEDNQSDTGSYELINLNSISIDGGLKTSGKFIEDGTDTLLENDLVMVLSDVGHGDLLGRVAIIPENNRYVLNQRVALLRIMDNTNPYFLFSIINGNQVYFKKEGAGSSQLNISKYSVENFIVDYPQIVEQRKIANYLSNLDNLITLHQRKLEKLKNLKKACLEKMFV